MVSLTCTAARVGGVTLVTGRVANPDRPRRIRVENCLDGPVWPPRRAGVPAEGWDADAFECVLAADETRPLGYASPADPVDRPMKIAGAEPTDPDGTDGFGPRADVPDVEDTAESVVRELDSPLPPRDAVATPDPDPGDGAGVTPATDRPDATAPVADTDGLDGEQGAASAAVAAVEAAVAVVEERVERTERRARTAQSVGTVSASGSGGESDRRGQAAVEVDRLRRIATRVSSLADRAEAVDGTAERPR